MRYLLLLIVTLFTGVITGQNEGLRNNAAQLTVVANATQSSFGATMHFTNPKRATDGSVHLFSGWDNFGVIITNDLQKFSLKNINLNIEKNIFVSKIAEDSLFTFNFNNIDRFIINNREFKNFYHNNDNRVFELIYESDEFTIMKGYRVLLIEGSANPMVNRKNNKLVQKSSIYLMKGNSIKPFKLSKKRILGLIEDNEERLNKMEKYVKANNLSYKKRVDVQRMLTFSLED